MPLSVEQLSEKSHPRRIRVLADDVINKIAAGEVIERPAAVVKELLENSLDAGAGKIEVEFRHGGKSYIRIEDNGCGMSPDEAMLALERHATSKLQTPDDLLKIVSMGFRGEALPSVASISRFTLKTRAEDREQGSEILVNGGKLIHHRDCGMAPGTRIEVANLFSSVPARRKFLKTDNTEAAHIVHLVRLYAVARPEVDFTLVEDGKVVFRSPRSSDLKHRVAEIWGGKMAEPLEFFPEITSKGMKAWGLLGRPGTGRSTRREMITLVNSRPIDSRTLSYALIEGYHTYIPKGRYPLAFLFLEIDPAAVDVNVHPAKREVRFRDEGQVRRFILEGVHKRLSELAAGEFGFVDETPPDKAAKTADQMIETRQHMERSAAVSKSEARDAVPKTKPEAVIPQPKVFPKSITELNRKPFKKSTSESQEGSTAPKDKPVLPRVEKPDKVSIEPDHDWRLVGRLQTGRVLFETPAGLVVLDLRAAHERVSFERIEKEFGAAHDSQRLLLPVSFELEPLAAAALLENLKFFQAQGFAVEEFGRNFFRLEAHPVWLKDEDSEAFVIELVEAIRDGKIDPRRKDLARSAFAKMASSRAIRINDAVTDIELRELVTKLLRCNQPLVCPNGKATYFELTNNEIKKRLGKT
ncbi:DNA mismatch repair endonuclease MutL [Rubellicoccus peritrichatus]|uniref:DNA mismatch repair protein MutL n=1 Tax=Rubellicoccus peritrichatus TaxID=3080537 RepID=A0AAQ3L953_9BACT|nr:DNA mismatch repair endonuclease MutL [Puniceicoccus sp. CR14]WOO39580.1 DNA mismatch repair endonuclease MutL [Puniceicoccus sp. CR14]